jgi:hypothetical protein
MAGDEKAMRMLLLPLSWGVLPSLLFIVLKVKIFQVPPWSVTEAM